MERRGCVKLLIQYSTEDIQEEILEKTKPFNIPKQLVWQAYKLVKANAGAAGIDHQSLKDFEKNLKDNLYKLWNQNVLRKLFSTASKGCTDTKEIRRRSVF